MYEADEHTGSVSRALVWAMLDSMSEAQLEKLLVNSTVKDSATSDLPSQLVELARGDEAVQREIQRCWRQEHVELIEAARLVAIDSSMPRCEAMLAQFGVEDVLLEMITDQHDDGWELAQWTVDNLDNDSIRNEMTRVLDRWRAIEAEPQAMRAKRRLRVVIFGGHPRDEQKMNERLFDGSRFDVCWKPFDKSQGSPEVKQIREAMSNIDAAIVVTTMVSHNVMSAAKRIAKLESIPFRPISKATDAQLRSVLDELISSVLNAADEKTVAR